MQNGVIVLIFSEKNSFAGQWETVINCVENVGKPRQLIFPGVAAELKFNSSEHTKQYSKFFHEIAF